MKADARDCLLHPESRRGVEPVYPPGGTWPKWSRDELFYWAGNTLLAVPYTASADGSFQMGTPTVVFTGADVGMGANNLMTSYNPEYDVNAQGTRFLVVRHLEDR